MKAKNTTKILWRKNRIRLMICLQRKRTCTITWNLQMS